MHLNTKKPRVLRTKIYIIILSALVLLGAFYVPTYGSMGEVDEPSKIHRESMIVNATWLDDEMLRIDVSDIVTGTVSSLAVRLSDFVTDADVGGSPYIMVQAVDLDGNLSGIVQIANPLYTPADSGAQEEPAPGQDEFDNAGDSDNAEPPQLGLTPDGTGVVVDNIVTQNDLEFFTVFTEAGNEFFLVVDRQRSTDNVYLLNAVTEADLMALAEGGSTSVSGIPAPAPEAPVQTPQLTPQPEPEPEPAPTRSSVNGSLIFIAVMAVAVGAAAYYFKIVKGKRASSEPDEDFWDDEEVEEDNYLNHGTLDESSDNTDERGDGE